MIATILKTKAGMPPVYLIISGKIDQSALTSFIASTFSISYPLF